MNADPRQLDLLQPEASTALHSTKQQRAIWPDPRNMKFELERDYDPMSMHNRGKPLKVREDD